MNTSVMVNEFAKMRHLHILLLVAVLFLAVTGIGLYSAVLNPDFDRTTEDSWNTLLTGLGSGFPRAAPLLMAVLASRLVDAEHQGGGWLLSATSGVTPGALCRAKLLALGILVAGATVLASAVLAVVGLAAGIDASWPLGRWIVSTLCLLVVTLALLALHVVLAARVENQLVGIGVGLLGTVVALVSASLPSWVAHLTPWGYYAFSAAADYIDGRLTGFAPSWASVIGLGLVAAVVFTLFTRSFDRQEA